MRDAGYAAPTPRVLYIHDDLSDDVRQKHGADSPAFHLTQELFAMARRNSPAVAVLTVEQQIELLLGHFDHAPFAVAVGIGRAGERVARQLHQRAGWFPRIRRVDITREEDGRGGYNLVSTSGTPWESQLRGLEEFTSVALVDDTLFSGLTLRTVLRSLPPTVAARVHAFCLRGVAETIPSIAAMCPISIGFGAPGRILDDVSFINASGLVMRVGIRRAGKPPMAFFERPAWIRAWFPSCANEAIALCRRVNALLEPALPSTAALPFSPAISTRPLT
ncbi:MAG: hypothetical protein HY260_13380 [Chloroflexi bacterium]|nr:hypothetical protein [Chloroflexota bacterium]